MDAIVTPGELSGAIPAISSKSMAHRLLILAALSPATTDLLCNTTSLDIEATASCLNALGAQVTRTKVGYRVVPVPQGGSRPAAHLDCGESGSTERFMLPVLAAMGCGGSITGHGRLAQRPLSPLYERLEEHGAALSPQGTFPLTVAGKISAGRYELPGDVSSQYISGLLLAAPLMEGPLEVSVADPVESRPYVNLTINALATFGVRVDVLHEEKDGASRTVFSVPDATLASPGSTTVEGDWSNAAFWLCAGATSAEGVTVGDLDLASAQGDRVILAALSSYGVRIARRGTAARATRQEVRPTTMDVSDFPDLVPPLAAVAAAAKGETRLCNAGRLRLKESDRLKTVSEAIRCMGGDCAVEGDDLVVRGIGHLGEGEVDSANDHRIAMMSAIAATNATGPVTIHGAECVRKSYPGFWEDFAALGGNVILSEE